eukprot:CAMPEP_0197057142 /NCGR_PEP_ID=MMETSP1384-20130603/93525_1 /TAXON_ID=29189 /ORGANISM="Ammonia sp." /LENGTH=221 /DNA_ID=CAMNT_0042491439 /DNA_START=59 /DNA_END=724 /DNA_ORIENTATION=+
MPSISVGMRFYATSASSDPTRWLQGFQNQHNKINETLYAFETFRRSLAKPDCEEFTASEDLAKFIKFFREYLGKIHNVCEEDAIFENIKDYGYSMVECHGGIYMASDHEECGKMVDRIESTMKNGVIQDRKVTSEAIKEFVPFLEAHAVKEDHRLFPRISQDIPEAVNELVSQDLAKLEEEFKPTADELLKVSQALIQKYGSERPPEEPERLSVTDPNKDF